MYILFASYDNKIMDFFCKVAFNSFVSIYSLQNNSYLVLAAFLLKMYILYINVYSIYNFIKNVYYSIYKKDTLDTFFVILLYNNTVYD